MTGTAAEVSPAAGPRRPGGRRRGGRGGARRPAHQVVGGDPPRPRARPRDRAAGSGTLPQHRLVLQPVPGRTAVSWWWPVALVAVLLVMAWRAPTVGPGRRPRAHPRRRAGQSGRPLLPGRPRRGGGLRRPPLLARPSTWPMPPSSSAASCWSLPAPGATPVVTRSDGDRAGLARRGPGGQGGGPAGRPVRGPPSTRWWRAGRVRIDGGPCASRSTALRAGQKLEVDRPDEVRAPVPGGRPRRALRGGLRRRPTSSWWTSRPDWWSIPGPATAPARWSTAWWPDSPSWPRLPGRWARSPTVPASSTGWTGAPRASWWWPARRTPTTSLVAQLAGRRWSRTYRALVLGTVEGESRAWSTPPSGDR